MENRPKLNDKGEWRCATIHRMGRRLPDWDYRREGYYVITIVLTDRSSQAFGRVVVKGSTPLSPEDVEAKIELSALGEAVFAHFRRMGEFTPGLKPVYCAMMPDHLHLLLKVETPLARPIGHAIAGFKTGCEKLYLGLGGSGRLFEEGFVDEIVLRAGQLAREFDYLKDNPRRLAVKRLFPELFKLSREIRVGLRFASQGRERTGSQELVSAVSRAPSMPIGGYDSYGYFTGLGNHFLLNRRLAQVQVSRSFFAYRRERKSGGSPRIARDSNGDPIVEKITPEFEAKRDELLARAERGEVLVSPCISDGEREIARQALRLGCNLVTLHNVGFSSLYKPPGRYFDACAAGRLLMLAPIAWPYQVESKPMTRFDATALNRLAQAIAGDGAVSVNYHGMTPNNVDELAREAARVEAIK